MRAYCQLMRTMNRPAPLLCPTSYEQNNPRHNSPSDNGRRGFTYTHKFEGDAITWARHSTEWGFTVNLSADDAGMADELSAHGLPVVCIVPTDTPERTRTPEGRDIVICPAQTRDGVTCETCGLCQKANRAVIVGFRAHGSKTKSVDQTARRVIPISRA